MEGRGEWEGRVGKEGGWEQTALGRACMIPNPQVIVTIVHGFNTIESERSLSFAFHCVYTNYESAVCVRAHVCVSVCVCVCVRACVCVHMCTGKGERKRAAVFCSIVGTCITNGANCVCVWYAVRVPIACICVGWIPLGVIVPEYIFRALLVKGVQRELVCFVY